MTNDRNIHEQPDLSAEEQRLSDLLDEALHAPTDDESMPFDLSHRIAAATVPLLGTTRAADAMDGPVPDLEPDVATASPDESPAVVGRIRPAHWFGGLVAAGIAAVLTLMIFNPTGDIPDSAPPTENGATAAMTVTELEAQLAHLQQFAESDTSTVAIDQDLSILAMDLEAVSRETAWLEDSAAYSDNLTDWMEDYEWPDSSIF